jgi:hypothetical protein
MKIKQSDWRPLATGLTSLANSEGSDHFLDRLFAFLNDFITVDSCAVFKVSTDKISGAEHMCTFGTLDDKLATLLAEDYIANGFKTDPMVQTALKSRNIKVRHLPASSYRADYRSQYFRKAGLIDKVTSIHNFRNALYLVSFYRAAKNSIFDAQDFSDLERLAPIIGRFVLSHVQLTGLNARQRNFKEYVTEITHDRTQVFAKLSHKERDVCTAILIGEIEKEIAQHG